MRLSYKYKFIFIAIPKTGSFTIRDYLTPYSDIALFATSGDNVHINIHEIRDKYFKNKKTEFTNYYKFAFVRNPWDQQVSRYHYHMQGPFGDRVPKRTFKEHILNNTWPINQSNWLTINKKYCVDHIGKFENLQQDFNMVCDKIGIPQQQLPHKNKSDHKHYTEYYDDETIDIVAKRYAQDIEHFGYEFGK